MSDLFHEDVPADYIGRVGEVMQRADWHLFQVLIKRDERLRVQFPIVERDPANLTALEAELSQLKPFPARVNVETSEGDAFERLSTILNELRRDRAQMAPAFLFVDPYGFKIPAGLLGDLMKAGRVELFMSSRSRESTVTPASSKNSTSKASWPLQNGFCRVRPTCGSRPHSTSDSGSNNCSFRTESRSTQIGLLEPA